MLEVQAAVAAQQQLQQAAALQAQAHLQAAAATFGQQQHQNPYISMWPYNMYPGGANWAAAAYARCRPIPGPYSTSSSTGPVCHF